MQNSQSREEAIDLLLKNYATELQKKSNDRCSIKGRTLSVRIFQDNLRFLLSEDGQQEACAYQDKIGTYFKALLEEYCQLPYVERERIYFRNQKDEIDLAIQNKQLLRIVTRKQFISYVKPLELCHDKEHMYHYLVGYASTNKNGPWKIVSFRLSSISECKRQVHSGYLTLDQKNKIRKAIAETGIQYLAGSDTRQIIRVEFTSYGEKQYRQILHLRPQYVSHDGLIYEFDCTLKQAEDYFFKFGHNARILEPIHLAEKFQRKYHNAAKKYNSI
jgi:predicted DNA-binding transcriptional regulator YafY